MMKLLTTLLLALSLMLPATGAMAERQPQKKGLFAALFAPKDGVRNEHGSQSNKARKANAKAAEARADVKEAVAHAIENRPKGRLWCVPFARMVTGVNIKGNATTWWKQAAGRYDRGQEPVVGAVMNFASSRSMPKGHVAVVSQVISEREILVDQANWERNRITEDTLVVDVSADGDWSQVRVANSAGTLGRTNPVYGFIYN